MSSPTPVTDRLERLARQAPARLGDPDQLWARGRRRQRTRWAGTATCLVLLAVFGAVAVPAAVQRTQGLVAVGPDDGLRLPDVIRQPGEWERATFPDAPGRLVAVGVGTRAGWWSSRAAAWGVSPTGESRFLDLPDAANGTESAPALSSDGRRLAYWITGRTPREPLRIGGQDPAVGVGVMDLETGEVERWLGGSPRGMATHALAWSGDVLWWSGSDYSDDSTPSEYGGYTSVWTWDVGRSDPRENGELGDVSYELAGQSGSAPGGLLVAHRQRRYDVLTLVRGGEVDRVMKVDARLDHQTDRAPRLSTDGTTVAGLLEAEDDSGGTPLSLVVGRSSLRPMMEPVGDVRTTALLGWRSPDEVVVETSRRDDVERVYGASVVNVDTAEVTPLVDFRGNVASFAADAWSADVIEAPHAPWAPDPRLAGLFLLVVGAFVVSLANSVRRRRDRA